MKLYGLIGYPLSHSFSKKYFAEKFENEGINDCFYDLFPLESIHFFPKLLEDNPNLMGLNVTIPYKEQIIPFLDKLEDSAAEIGAVNTIRFESGKTVGFNTDVYGFEQSILPIIHQKYAPNESLKALILGTGGASKAVFYALSKNNILPTYISRIPSANQLTYSDLTSKNINDYSIIVNTTPLGMSPNIETCPMLPYHLLTERHLLYDLVYNPEISTFLQKGMEQKASIKNGLEMLHLQAEKAWDIWKKR